MQVDSDPSPSSSVTRLTATWDNLEPLSSSFVIAKVARPRASDAKGKGKGKGTEDAQKTSAFRNQYASVYFSRLMALKKIVNANAEKKWKDVVRKNPQSGKQSRVLDVKPGALCIVIGTVYMEMRLKPNILEDIAREQHVAIPPPRPKFLSDDDEVMLEDESGRVRLVGKVIEDRKFPLVTGVIAAVLGAENQSGDFEVVDMCFAGLAPQPSLSTGKKAAAAEEEDEEEAYVVLASGLEMGSNEEAADERISLFAEWLRGEGASAADQDLARRVVRLILAGNSMAQPVRSASSTTNAFDTPSSASAAAVDKKPQKKTYGYDASVYSAAPTDQFDAFLSSILPSLSVVLMSGERDPVGITLPQQTILDALLPQANKFQNLKFATNPTWFDVNGTSFLGTAGQNIDDIFKYLESDNRLDMACSTLEWSHMAPTAPDTLFCFPFQDRDPFILTRTPHVYFIGNQPRAESRLITSEKDENGTSVRVILVPSFKESGQVVLVNLKTRGIKVLQFAS